MTQEKRIPLYKHDCKKCKYVESSKGPYKGHGLVDWYVCGENNNIVLWRHSNEPSHEGATDILEHVEIYRKYKYPIHPKYLRILRIQRKYLKREYIKKNS